MRLAKSDFDELRDTKTHGWIGRDYGLLRTLYCVKGGRNWCCKQLNVLDQYGVKSWRHDFLTLESARAFVREHWGRVVVVRIYRKGK